MPQHITTRTKQLGVRKLATTDVDYTLYSVKSTFTRIPETNVVLVPWRVFSADPESVCDSFREMTDDDTITYADDINVMLNVEGLKTPEFGALDDFSQTWIINTDEINLDHVIEHIKNNQILLGVTLTNRKLLGNHDEIPMVAFLDHKTPEVREAVMKLETCRDLLAKDPSTKFAVEVDIGDSVSRFASEVLGQSMTSVGGRFCVTNGEKINHAFDWSNICAFLPIICCCLIAIPIYKLKRKLSSNDYDFMIKGDSCILGAKTFNFQDQRTSLLTLMRRARLDPKFARESPDSGVHLPVTLPPAALVPAESFTKKDDKTAVLKKQPKSNLKHSRGIINVGYDKNKKDEELPAQEEITVERQDSFMQADDLDTIARAFKMSKATTGPERRESVVSPVTLSNFRADLLFCDVDDSDEEGAAGSEQNTERRESNFLDPNYEQETNEYFKSNPNPLTNIELMHFLTTKNKPASIRNEEEQRKLEAAKSKRSKVGKGWGKVMKNFDDKKLKK